MNYKKLLKQVLFVALFFNLFLPVKANIEISATSQQSINQKVHGQVIDKMDNTPLIGVSVVVKGTTRGVVTDLDGNYTLEIEEGDKTIVFSYIGMKTIIKNIGDLTEINVSMNSDAYGLEEVIISGVASATPKKKLTVSVVSISGDELKEAHSSSAASALQSKVAGLQVIHANGLPGSGASLRLRGSTSLTGNQSPMIMLDGNIIYTSLSDINLDDIESFEVVKGAAAAALYGSQAGNGVIVLISKRGKKEATGSSTVTLRTEIGFQELSKKLELSTHHPYVLADDWEDYPYTRYDGIFYYNDKKISGSRQLTENAFADQKYASLYDNQDFFFKKGLYHTEYIGITGNEEKTNFLVSFENNKQEGIIFETDGYQRNNIKVNIDRFISDKLKISTSNLMIKTTSNNPGSYKTFQDVLFMSPDIDLRAKNSDSTDYKILPDDWGIAENPLYPLANIEKESKRFSLIGNVKLNYYITNWLNADAKFTYEVVNKNWTTLTPKGYLAGNKRDVEGKIYKSAYDRFNNNTQLTLNANKQFNDFTTKLKLSYLYENTSYSSLSVTGRDFIFDGVPHLNNTNPEKTSLNSYNGNIVSINYFGIADFDYKDKYLFSVLYRIDGSSLFGENVRWNPYYRISSAYRLTEDIQIPGIDELKLRAAMGTSGQRPGYSNQYETWSISGGKATKNTVGNKNLKPSTTKEIELGFYVDFLNRFSLESIYSNSITENAIDRAPIPSQYGGYAYQYQNLGTIGGTSVELNLKMNLIKRKSFTWNSNIIFDRIRQHIIKLDIPDYNKGPKNAFVVKEGEVFGTIYGYKWITSLDQMEKQLPEGKSISDYKVNSDGYVVPNGSQGTINEIPINIDENNDGLPDKLEIGNGNPNFNLSLGNTINYKGINLYFLFAWKNGGDVYNFTKQYSYRDLRAVEFDQSEKAEGEKKTINYYSTFYKNTEVNSYFIEDGSFIKLREVSLSYNMNKKTLQNLFGGFVNGVKIGVEARNLFTFTEYTGYDPEVASGADLSNYPFDEFGYPNFKTYSASIKLTF